MNKKAAQIPISAMNNLEGGEPGQRDFSDGLAVSGTRYADGFVVGVSAAANQRTVADSPRPLGGDSAGRGRRRDVASAIDRDGAHGLVTYTIVSHWLS